MISRWPGRNWVSPKRHRASSIDHGIALGHRRRSRNPWSRDSSPPDLMTRATPYILDAARHHHVARVLFVGVHGCGDSRARTGFIYRYLVERTTIGIALRDFNVMEGMLTQSGLDWLVARPVSLVDGTATGRCRVRDGRISSLATVRRADVAAFMLAHLDGAIADRTPSISA